MKRLPAIILTITLLAACGCINTIKHVPLGQTVDVYQPTCFVAKDAVGVWVNSSYQKQCPIEASWLKLTWLVWVADLPCEAVMDTLWFPYDFYCKKRFERHQAERAARDQKPRFGAENLQPAYQLSRPYELDVSR